MPNPSELPPPSFAFGRRRLLQGGLVLFSATMLDATLPTSASGQEFAGFQLLRLRRREDQLNLNLQLFGLNFDGQQLTRGSGRAFIVVEFPPQHVLEEAFLESDPALEPITPETRGGQQVGLGVRARLSGTSRLAFRIPDDIDAIPLTPEGLFNWAAWTASLVGAAQAPGAAPSQPSGTQTAIELPWWLLLSPDDTSGWAHSATPVDLGGPRTELWHTRLARLQGGELSEDSPRPVRAVWARDQGLDEHLQGEERLTDSGVPFADGGLVPMYPVDRGDIVMSTAGWPGTTAYRLDPEPVEAHRLALSPFGGWLDSTGNWAEEPEGQPASTSLESWRHIAAVGRDNYVRIVRRGFLFPFGHRASLVRVTERRFTPVQIDGQTRQVALLRQKFFIIVREPVQTYGTGVPFGGAATPFDRIEVLTLTTPSLDAPPNDVAPDVGVIDLQGEGPGAPPENASEVFVPAIDGEPFRFVVDARDYDGVHHTFTSAVAFVELTSAENAAVIDRLIDRWESQNPDGPLRRSDLQGRRVMLSEPSTDKPGNSEAITNSLSWSGVPFPGQRPAFSPFLSFARIVPEAAEAMLGGAVGSDIPMSYTAAYLDAGGFLGGPLEDAGAFMAFADDLVDEVAPGLDFAGSGKSDRSGGSVSPGLVIRSLSRAVGIAGDPSTLLPTGGIDLAALFSDLGGFLGNILLENVLPTDVSLEEGPFALESRREGDIVTSRMTVNSGLVDWPSDDPVFLASEGTPAKLLIEVTNVVPLTNPQAATTDIVGEVTNFSIILFGPVPFIQVDFSALTFEARPGQSPTVDPGIIDVFPPDNSPLNFIDQVLSLLPTDTFGFDVDISAAGVTAGLDTTFPTITIGALQIHQPNLGVAVTIPFNGDPFALRFNLGRRDLPIAVTYLALGGGFWFEVEVTGSTVILLTVGIEVRASAEVGVGPFKAKGSIAVGIFFSIENKDGQESAILGGYIRAEVEVNVLILGVHITFELVMTYDFNSNQATGRATVEIEVEIAFIGFSWSIEVERKIGGGGGGGGGLRQGQAAGFLGPTATPRFGDTLAEGDWAAYCDAFAPVA
ncbi:hypothetical protein [Euzebya tangerina]|uniref:hypothetical protein n=1 Tax=Euzebya tangerina TaxID=591198 RepID=UPI000E319147|nr:hypothetical protein [Euzebya tangerina]